MRLAVATVLVLATAIPVVPARAGAGGTMTGAAFRKLALSAAGVSLNGATVSSGVDLSGRTVRGPLTCRNCTFKGIVDLRGTTLDEDVSFSESTFKAPALFGPRVSGQKRVTTFSRQADFSLATFDDLATFESASFRHVDFRLARFDSGATFALASMNGDTEFAGAVFQGRADFGNADFSEAVGFQGVEFSGPVDFGLATYEAGPVSFDRARFDSGATFVATTFPADTSSFMEARSGAGLDFSFAQVGRLNFTDMVVDGEISFHDANLTARRSVNFTNVSATSLDLDVGTAVTAIDSGQLPMVLALIESSAKQRGNLGVANDAHFERKVLESQQDGWLGYALDVFFYRTIAGYLVRPLRPLAALLLLAAILTLVHAGRKAWRHPAAAGSGLRNRARAQYVRAREILSPLGNAYLQTLALVVPGKGPSADERPVRWLEAIVYRVLFVCVLIGFANSNPTLRQMLDAIR